MSEIKDYLHLYVGANYIAKVPELDEPNYELPISHVTLKRFQQGDYEWLKPILRPLSDITKEEKQELDNLFFPPKEYGKRRVMLEAEAERTHYLLSKHFDLFGLIESGLAISKINNQ